MPIDARRPRPDCADRGRPAVGTHTAGSGGTPAAGSGGIDPTVPATKSVRGDAALPQDDARNDPAEAGPQSAARFGVEAGMAGAGLGHRAHEARVDRSRIGQHGDLHRHRRPDPTPPRMARVSHRWTSRLASGNRPSARDADSAANGGVEPTGLNRHNARTTLRPWAVASTTVDTAAVSRRRP